MKFSLALITIMSAPAMISAYNVGGFDMWGRPYIVSPRGRTRFGKTGCGPGRRRSCNTTNKCVDKSFQDLKQKIRDDRMRGRRGRRRFTDNAFSPWAEYGDESSSFQMDEETLRQQEEWINRAFGLATDVAKGMASTPQEEEEAKEAIRQSKEVVDNIFGFVAQDVEGRGAFASVPTEVVQDDANGFAVTLDVPGCKAADIDVAVEGAADKEQLLVVRGTREMAGKKDVDGGIPPSKEFRKAFALDASSVIDDISVVLENGVLVVSVPRDPATKVKSTVKIPVAKVETDASEDDAVDKANDEPEEQRFEVEVDVPGVLQSDIDVTIEGDVDKMLVVTAIRELGGKESDGSPKTKTLSRTFKIDDLADADKLVATLSNGVLRVTAPVAAKKEEAFTKKIDVTQASKEDRSSGSEDEKSGDEIDREDVSS